MSNFLKPWFEAMLLFNVARSKFAAAAAAAVCLSFACCRVSSTQALVCSAAAAAAAFFSEDEVELVSVSRRLTVPQDGTSHTDNSRNTHTRTYLHRVCYFSIFLSYLSTYLLFFFFLFVELILNLKPYPLSACHHTLPVVTAAAAAALIW